jgi:hypothetical protein
MPTADFFLGLALAAGVLPSVARADTAAPAGRVSFMVSDETDPQEIAEDTAVFINGTMVAHFNLDSAHPAGNMVVSVPAAPHYDYALCGHITLRKPDGQTAMHQVDSAATLSALSGRSFQLLAAADFTLFYMADQAAGAQDMPADVHKAGSCSVPVS